MMHLIDDWYHMMQLLVCVLPPAILTVIGLFRSAMSGRPPSPQRQQPQSTPMRLSGPSSCYVCICLCDRLIRETHSNSGTLCVATPVKILRLRLSSLCGAAITLQMIYRVVTGAMRGGLGVLVGVLQVHPRPSDFCFSTLRFIALGPHIQFLILILVALASLVIRHHRTANCLCCCRNSTLRSRQAPSLRAFARKQHIRSKCSS